MKKFLLLCLLSISGVVCADNIRVGEYITESGWGNLAIKQHKGIIDFKIFSFGANGHSCSLDGEILNGKAELKDTVSSDEKCVIDLKKTEKSIVVSSDGSTCRDFCGVRAGFEGEYFKAPKVCWANSITTARNNFKALYKDKKYEDALNVLKGVMDNCEDTLFWTEKNWVLNDLSITYAKLERYQDCIDVLNPLKESMALSTSKLAENYAPMDADEMIKIVKAAKTNYQICRKHL